MNAADQKLMKAHRKVMIGLLDAQVIELEKQFGQDAEQYKFGVAHRARYIAEAAKYDKIGA